MKTALDCYARGKQKEVKANDYDRNKFYWKDRFICPECGEAVFLAGKINNYFSHFKKNDLSIECSKRVDGSPTGSVYERIGLSIYMRENFDNTFYLYMGFRAIPSLLMKKAISNFMSVEIGNRKYMINEERFSCNEMILFPLDYIPRWEKNYQLYYQPENMANEISQYWSNYADGFSYEGAIFTISEQCGKKIRRGDSITTDREYYWVRYQSELPKFIPGINMKKCGKLKLKNESLTVFSGIFSSDISDEEFSSLSSYLRINLNIHLLEKQPEFIPIWPPMTKTENGYIIDDSKQKLYGYVVSGNDAPKAYVYQGIKKIPEELNLIKNIACIRMNYQDLFINIDRKYVSNGTLISKYNEDIVIDNAKIYELIDNEYVPIERKFTYRNCHKICFKTENCVNFILIQKNGKMESKRGIGEYSFENLQSGDLIYILQGKYLISIFTIKIEEIESNIKIKDKELYYLLKKYKNTKKVNLSYSLRKKIYENQSKFILSKNYISDILKNNTINIAIVKVLEEILSE